MLRVLPRDAFNDASLLKCIGKLTMLIEDGFLDLKYEYDGEPFDIRQDESDGSTFVRNITFYLTDADGRNSRLVGHKRPMNSRDNWPLMLYFDGDEYYAFNEKGEYMPSFGQLKP